MLGELVINVGLAPSDSKVTVGGQEVAGVRRIEIISEVGKPSQAMLFMTPSAVTMTIAAWDVNSETAMGIAKAIAKRLSLDHFLQEIYQEIVHYTGGTHDSN